MFRDVSFGHATGRAPLNVAVLYGGDSAERDVSLASGGAVASALGRRHHRVVLIDPACENLDEVAWTSFDVALLALHGGAGEDGRIQARLERLGVPYTGSGPAVCRVAMSKSASKERFWQLGVPTPPYALIHANDALDELQRKVHGLARPLIIKPDSQGSSIGVAVVRGMDELAPAVQWACQYEAFLIAEPRIAGREFTLTLIDDQPLPLLEICAENGLFDYAAKYHRPTRVVVDPPLPLWQKRLVIDAGVEAARALKTRGLVRVDIMLDDEGQPWVLEVNTVPGMTDHSLAPRAAAAAGLDFPRFCEQLCRLALACEVTV